MKSPNKQTWGGVLVALVIMVSLVLPAVPNVASAAPGFGYGYGYGGGSSDSGSSTGKGLSNSIFGTFCEGSPDPGTLIVGGSKPGRVDFSAGACNGKIVVGPVLPRNAADNVPAGTQGTLYVRVVGGEGTYSACFTYDASLGGTIYRYVNGTWVSVPVFFSEGMICTTASGDGVFILN